MTTGLEYKVEPIMEAGQIRFAVYTLSDGIKHRVRGFDNGQDAATYAAGRNAGAPLSPSPKAVKAARAVLAGKRPFGRNTNRV